MRSSSLVRRFLAPAGVVLSLLLLPTAGSAEPGPFPGLPQVPDAGPPLPDTIGGDGDRNLVSWFNTSYNGMTGSARSQQWVRLPTRTLATNVAFGTCDLSLSPCPYPVPDDTVQVNVYDIAAFMVSPEGTGSAYGTGPVIPVRTVAFGAIPVEAEIQLEQVRDEDGLPRPLMARHSDRVWSSTGAGGASDTRTTEVGTLEGQLTLGVRRLVVDGVDVGLGGCRTPAFDLMASSEEATGPLTQEYLWGDPDRSVFGFDGGGFHGSVDIPAFEGCRTTGGDDVSAVLTSFLSGPGNPVAIRYGGLASCQGGTDGMGPVAPGADLPAEPPCQLYDPSGGNPKWNSIPLPREYPTYAPGDAAGQ